MQNLLTRRHLGGWGVCHLAIPPSPMLRVFARYGEVVALRTSGEVYRLDYR